jgi:nucleoside-diphosphate-sugar epimerase
MEREIKLIQAHEVEPDLYTIPNQPLRFAGDKDSGTVRVMDLEKIYKPDFIKGKTVLVTGGNRGIGLAVAKELVTCGANVIISTRAPVEVPGVKQVISGIDVTDNDCGIKLAKELNGQCVDVLINNAGYFFVPVEKIDSLNFEVRLVCVLCACCVRTSKPASSQRPRLLWFFTST